MALIAHQSIFLVKGSWRLAESGFIKELNPINDEDFTLATKFNREERWGLKTASGGGLSCSILDELEGVGIAALDSFFLFQSW